MSNADEVQIKPKLYVFIAGIRGSGKTTLAGLIRKMLEDTPSFMRDKTVLVYDDGVFTAPAYVTNERRPPASRPMTAAEFHGVDLDRTDPVAKEFADVMRGGPSVLDEPDVRGLVDRDLILSRYRDRDEAQCKRIADLEEQLRTYRELSDARYASEQRYRMQAERVGPLEGSRDAWRIVATTLFNILRNKEAE